MSPRAPVSVAQPVVGHDAALRVVRAALERAEALGAKVCVAVVDSAGHLAAFARMPGVFLISSDLARKKAHSVAAIGHPADVIETVLAQEAPRVREGLVASGFTMIQGAVPLHDGDALIGAVGVSGGSEAQDTECAKAGAAALHG